MQRTDFWRQTDIVTPAQLNKQVTVIGAGGIGSPTILGLAKMGVTRFKVYDGDFINNHNLPNQFFRLDDVGKKKSEAIKEIVSAYAEADVEALDFYTGQRLRGIVVSAVDSMEVRNQIWNKVKMNPSVDLFIDGRMGGEQLRIYTIRPTLPAHVREFEESLYTDAEALEIPCTAQAIIYNTMMVASLIGSQVKAFSTGSDAPVRIIFDFVTHTFMY